MNQNLNWKMIPIPVPIPPTCAKMAKEPESRFLRNRNLLSTSIYRDVLKT